MMQVTSSRPVRIESMHTQAFKSVASNIASRSQRSLKIRSSLQSSSSTAHAQRPARTCSEAVLRARQALRSVRDAKASGELTSSQAGESSQPTQPASSASSPSPTPFSIFTTLFQGSASSQPGQLSPAAAALQSQSSQQLWISVELPLPVKPSLLTSAGVDGERDLIRASDEGDWPGGMQQRFRALRPLVEAMLEGYDYTFLGLLESDADGVGLWSTPDMTVIGVVTNPTFPSLVKLLEGGYGARVQQPGHIVLAVNPQWTSPEDVGQPWDRSLKEKAGVIMGTPEGSQAKDGHMTLWETVECHRLVRTGSGATGLLSRTWPGPWKLHATPCDDSRELGPLVLTAATSPSRKEIAAALASSKDAMDARAKEIEQEDKARRGPFPW